MTIPVECPKCGSRYAAPAAMAGKRVRCKHCSHVIEIVRAEADPYSDFSLEPESLGSVAEMPGRGAAPPSTPALPEDPEHAFASAFADYVQPRRPNTAYKFPSATLLDRWLPIALVAFGVFCLGVPTITAALHVSPGWVAPLRMGLFVVLYVGVICPILWFCARAASNKAKFDLPPRFRWRMSAAFSFSFGFACFLWIATDSLGGLIPGAITGLAVGLAAVWMLLRIQQGEAGVTLGLAAAGFSGGLLLMLGILIALNAVVLQMAKTSKSPTALAYSPIAPGLAWVDLSQPGPSRADNSGPEVVASATTQDTAATAPADPTTEDAVATVATTVPATTGAVATSDKPNIFNPRFVQPQQTPRPPGEGGHPTTGPRPTESTSGQPGTPGSPDDPQPTPGDDAFIAGIRKAQSPWVVSVKPLSTGSSLSAFSPALAHAPWAVLTNSGKATGRDSNDALQFWSLFPQPQLRYRRPQCHPDPDRHYVISPSGNVMGRVVRFPSFGIELWSTEQASLLKVIPFPADHATATPTVIGFLAEERLLIRWQRSSDNGVLEVYDTKIGKPLRPINEPRHAHAPGNWAVSADAKFFAMVAIGTDHGMEKPQVVFAPFTESTNMARLPIPGLDPQWAAEPQAIAFSPDSKRLAVLFEHQGNAAIYSWRLSDRKLAGPVLLAAEEALAQPIAGPDPVSAGGEAAPSQFSKMIWLGDSGALLVHGDLVVDPDTGRTCARLGAPGALSAWSSGNICLLLYRGSDAMHLAEVRFQKPQ